MFSPQIDAVLVLLVVLLVGLFIIGAIATLYRGGALRESRWLIVPGIVMFIAMILLVLSLPALMFMGLD